MKRWRWLAIGLIALALTMGGTSQVVAEPGNGNGRGKPCAEEEPPPPPAEEEPPPPPEEDPLAVPPTPLRPTVPPQVCGDGLCAPGEHLTCPFDCLIPRPFPNIPPRTTP